MDDWQHIHLHLQQIDSLTRTERIDRVLKSTIHEILPGSYFSAASSECRDMFIAGHYYGCITLTQSVAEGICKYIADCKKVKLKGDFQSWVARLRRTKIISDLVADAFLLIHGRDRNDFHHLNKIIEQDREKLEARALDCLDCLFLVESEVFAYDTDNEGRMIPRKPEYWPQPTPKGDILIEARFE